MPFEKKQTKFITESPKLNFFFGLIVGIAVISLISLLFFDRFFELFHLILFPQGNWQFNASSLMIQTYQQSFFQEFFVRVIVVAFIFLLLLIFLIKIIERINHQQ
ncbi:DUF1461 domain-containing protein [Patescibacteria group bacterium]|nr:DUF1461 domain-containing protein [Patescibacteria group bacterium]